jgi:hypothetical protein
MIEIPGFPPLQKKKKSKKSKKWTLGFPFFSYASIQNNDSSSDMGAPDFGGDAGGGMGESTITKVETDIKDDSQSEHEFSCLMLNLTPAVSAIVSYWSRRFIPKEKLSVEEGEDLLDGYEDTPHTTVKYGIHTSSPEEVRDCLEGHGPVLLKLGKVSKFEQKDKGIDVIHIEVESDLLREMNKDISSNLECTDEFNEYNPHITLAYVKSGSCDDLIGNDFFTMLSDTVDEALFAAKDGEEYFISLELE